MTNSTTESISEDALRFVTLSAGLRHHYSAQLNAEPTITIGSDGRITVRGGGMVITMTRSFAEALVAAPPQPTDWRSLACELVEVLEKCCPLYFPGGGPYNEVEAERERVLAKAKGALDVG